MRTYVSKPVEIQAEQLTRANVKELAHICGGRIGEDADAITRDGKQVFLIIPTLEGNMQANEGDYIIKGTHGEFYPCKPDVFATKYRPA